MADAPLRTLLARLGFEFDGAALDNANKKVSGFANGVKLALGALAATGIGVALQGWIADVRQARDEFFGLARTTGMSTEEAQRWTTAAKLTGASVGDLNIQMRYLMRNAAEAAGKSAAGFADIEDAAHLAAGGTSHASKAFKDLGVSVKLADGQIKPTSQLFEEVGIAISRLRSPAARVDAAMKIFGRSGQSLLPLFSQGATGVKKARDALGELGGGVSSRASAALLRNKIATAELGVATLSLKNVVVEELLPGITRGIDLTKRVALGVQRFTKDTGMLQRALVVLGVGFTILRSKAVIAAAVTYAAWLPWIALAGALVLAVDDIWVTIQGGDSVINRVAEHFGLWSVPKLPLDDVNKKVIDVGKNTDRVSASLARLANTALRPIDLTARPIVLPLDQAHRDWQIFVDWVAAGDNPIVRAIDRIGGLLGVAADGVTDGFNNAVGAGFELLRHSVNQLGYWIQETAKDIWAGISADAGDVGAVIGLLFDGVKQRIGAIIAGGIADFRATLAPFQAAFGAVSRGIEAAIVGTWTWLRTSALQAGADLVMGVVTGVLSKVGQIEQVFADMGATIIDTFKRIFGIHSPSAVMHDLTAQLPRGSIEALVEYAPRVQAAADATLVPAMGTASPYAPRAPAPPVASSTSNRIDQRNEVTIRLEGSGGAQAVRNGVIEGMGLAFDDERRALSAMLVAQAP